MKFAIVPAGGPFSNIGFRIAEIVTSQGHWITWPELFTTHEAAQKYLDKTKL